MRYILIPILITISSTTIWSKGIETDTLKTFSLGEVVVMDKLPVPSGQMISSSKINEMDILRVSEALEWLPGLTIKRSPSREETEIYLRGFSQQRVPIYIDGIPIHAPYDGTLDLGRLQTSTISKIQVSKGTSSFLLGGNAMGGSVNIVSAAPQDKLELRLQASTLWNSSVNIGSKQEKWYIQLDGGWIHRNNFRLPSGVEDVAGLQEGSKRQHSKKTDYQKSSKIGFTPKAGDEYVVGYNMVRSDKYVPPYMGTTGKARFWRFKDWDKDQVYFFSKTQLTSNWNLGSRLYYDRYYNQLKAYDDNEYNSQDSKSAFSSYYNDYSIGGGLSLSWNGIKDNQLKVGVNYKNYTHKSNDDNDPKATQSEYNFSLAVEDTWSVDDKLSLLVGVGYFRHKGTKVEVYEQLEGEKDYGITNYPKATDNDFNYQLAVDYKFNANNDARFSFSRNSRFATLKERYSYKRGKAIPNKDLGTENSYNLDLTYNGRYSNLQWYGSAYYMFLDNIIQEITGVDATDLKVWQLQNKGKAHFRGVEVGLSYNYKWLKMETNYSYINRVNKTDRNMKFIEVPDNKWNAMIQVNAIYDIRLMIRMTAQSKAYDQSDGSVYIPGHSLFHTNIAKKVNHFDIKLGVKNIFDKLYYYSEGFPEEGRQFYASISYNLNLK